MTLHLRHAPEPIQIQLVGNSLKVAWMAHCCCSWRDADHICDSRQAAVDLSLEHIAGIPDMWMPPAA